MFWQKTVREKIQISGIGLHTGKTARIEILPAPVDHGIVFVRSDAAGNVAIKAQSENVVDTRLATTLGTKHAGSLVSISTVEHLMAALAGMGVDNATICVDGPEVPIMDGSAGAFVDALVAAGLESQTRPRRFLVIKKEVKVRQGDGVASLSPGRGFRVRCGLDFDHPLIPTTPLSFELTPGYFQNHLSRARTFGFLKDVEMLRSAGLALGGSLDNALVIDEYRVLNPEGLRYPDEFVRHKAMDAIGDFALLGLPIIGQLKLHCSGHALNGELVAAVLSDSRNYTVSLGTEMGSEDWLVPETAGFPVLDSAKGVA